LKISIERNSDHTVVAEILFTSDDIDATGLVKKTSDGTKKDVETIKGTVEKYASMSKVSVYTDQGYTRIWSGFAGWMSGLSIVLPPIGYRIGKENNDTGID